MAWIVEYGFASTKEEQANPPPGMMQTSGPFPSEQMALNDAAGRLGLGATDIIVKDDAGKVVADFDAIRAHMSRPKPGRR